MGNKCCSALDRDEQDTLEAPKDIHYRDENPFRFFGSMPTLANHVKKMSVHSSKATGKVRPSEPLALMRFLHSSTEDQGNTFNNGFGTLRMQETMTARVCPLVEIQTFAKTDFLSQRPSLFSSISNDPLQKFATRTVSPGCSSYRNRSTAQSSFRRHSSSRTRRNKR